MARFLSILLALITFSLFGCPQLELIANRAEVITSLSGDRFDLKVEVNGQTKLIAGSHQVELERRANLPSLPIKRENYRYDRMENLKTPADIAVSILDEGTAVRVEGDSILQVSPLKSRAVVGPHGSSSVSMDGVNLESTDFTTEVVSKYISLTKDGRNPMRELYIIGRQKEKGTYFDGDNAELEKQGVALRLKTWSSTEENTASSPKSRSVFVKVQKGTKGAFTQREEYQVKISPDYTDADILSVAKSLLTHVGVKPPENLTPRVEVENLRHSLDITVEDRKTGATRKVGFLTVDSFNGTKAGENKSTPQITQFELEIFPDEEGFYQRNASNFAALFQRIEEPFHAKVDTAPKYMQILRKR